MKWRWAGLFWLMMAVLLVTALGSVWAEAQDATNAPARALTIRSTLDMVSSNAPPLTFGLDQVPVLRDNRFCGQPLWKYVASMIYIAFAFSVAWLIDIIITHWLKKRVARNGSAQNNLILDLLRGPFKVIFFIIFLNIGLGVFDWPDRVQQLLSHGFILVVACSVTYVVLKVVDVVIALWRQRIAATQDKVFTDQLVPLVSKAIKVLLVIIAALVTADNLNIRIGSILAGLSVGGLALGLAAQDTVANLFGAVAVFLDKPFAIGDHIRILGVEGTVESIGLRSTRIRNLDGHHVTIPNKSMGNEVITNITRRPTIKTEMNFGLTYETTSARVERATQILHEIIGSHPRTLDVSVGFNKFTDSALNVQVIHLWNGTNAREHLTALQALNLKIKERFDAEKIEFAFPTHTVFLKSDSHEIKQAV